MVKKEEILELMRIYQKPYDQYTECIMFEDWSNIAESLVKLCNKHFVSDSVNCQHPFSQVKKINDKVHHCQACDKFI